jgi:hypothetical protein
MDTAALLTQVMMHMLAQCWLVSSIWIGYTALKPAAANNLLKFLRVVSHVRICHTQLQLFECALCSFQLVYHIAFKRPAGHMPAAVPALPQHLLLYYWHRQLQRLLP